MNDDPASPVCYAAQGSDAYMGFASRDEIVAALNELLEAERAGARVTLNSKGGSHPEIAALMTAIHADEARWCAMLSEQVTRLGGTASSICGEFYDKAMAIPDPTERVIFLNRGQAWVVRKLGELLPRIRDDRLHVALSEMRLSHIENIEQAARVANGG
ncbi:MAG: DUF6306 domain-containing protein [Pseudomonadota bacterium]